MRLDGFDELEQEMLRQIQQMPDKRDRFVAREAEVLLAAVKEETPKDTGVLRGGWHRTQASQGAVEVYNNTDYAAHVEYGHRTRGGKGFVMGRKMLHRGLLAYKKAFPRRVGEALRKILEED